MLKHILLVGLLSFSTLPLLKAQSCGNDEKYHLPSLVSTKNFLVTSRLKIK